MPVLSQTQVEQVKSAFRQLVASDRLAESAPADYSARASAAPASTAEMPVQTPAPSRATAVQQETGLVVRPEFRLRARMPQRGDGFPGAAQNFSANAPPAEAAQNPEAPRGRFRPSILETCANPGCGSGWLHLLRSRAAPVFEGGWNCSPACTTARIAAAARRELEGRGSAVENHRHRIPLGLVMLEQGWITAGQLKKAVDAQRSAGAGRLGSWLVRSQGVSEKLVTRALGLQWSCPVLPLEFHDAEAVAPLLPRLFVDAFGALPLRVAAGKLIYMGFEDRLDPLLALAVERMTKLRVESGLVQGSLFHQAHTRLLSVRFPPVELVEAVSEPAIVQVLAKAIEKARPVESRLVRMHDCLWLRMWRRPQDGPVPDLACVQDLICSIGMH